MSNKFPQGWITTTLDDVCAVITDGTHQTPKYVSEGIPFISTANLRPFSSGFDFSEYKRFILSKEHAELTKRCRPERGDILISKCGTIGRVKEVDVDFAFSIFVGVALLKLYGGIFRPKFAEFWLNCPSVTKQFEELSPGSTRRTLTLKGIKSVTIPIPPLNEQQRIVAKLEKLLGKVEVSQKRLTKISVILKRFRQSVLAAACSGRLTADWRKQHVQENAGADVAIDFSELPSSWRWDSLGKLFTIETGTTPPKKDSANYSKAPTDCPFFKPTDLDAGANVREAREWLSKKGEEFARILPPLTVCVTSIGATIGKTGLLRVRGVTNQQINAILPSESILPQFTFLYCRSSYFQRRIIEDSSSTTLPIINKSRFEELEFPLPPLAEQQKIVHRVEALFALADQIEARYIEAQAHVDKLTPSLLSKAFRGELVAQDPNDEPASELLKRLELIQEKISVDKRKNSSKI